MAILKPSIGKGPCSKYDRGPCYFPMVALVPDMPGAYIEEAIGYRTMQQALDELEKRLRADFNLVGDQIVWEGVAYDNVAEAIFEIRANPITVPWP